MKNKDYYRLAKLSLNEHKKKSKSTVMGLSFGFIILLPIIVCLLGINYNFNKQINQKPYIFSYNVANMTDYRIKTDDYNSVFMSGYENIDFFDKDKNIKNKIVYETDRLTGDYENTTKYKIDNGAYKPINSLDINHYCIIDIEKSDGYFPKNITEKFPGGIFLNNYNQGFIADGKKEVIISENMLSSLGVTADEVYQKKLTISSDSYTDKDNSLQKFSGYICKDYVVVGIIKNDVTALYNKIDDFMSANMFFTSVNVYNNHVAMLKPYYKQMPTIVINTGSVSTSNHGHTYENFDKREELNEEYMMLGSYDSSFGGPTFFATNIYIESDTYYNLHNSYIQSEKYINSILVNKSIYPLKKSTLFEKYQSVYEIILLASSVFLMIAFIVIICAMINVYVTIRHSVEQKTFYLTMLRAIGAKNNAITKLYIMESGILITRASLLIITIGFIVSSTIKMLIDRTLSIQNISHNLSISYFIIILCILFIVVFLYVFAILVSYLCTYKLSKKPIVSILNEK